MKKKLFILIVFILFVSFFPFSIKAGEVSSPVDTNFIYQNLKGENVTYTGAYYKVGIMDNFNTVKTKGSASNADCNYYMFLPISNTIQINGRHQVTFTRYLSHKTTTFVAFTNQLKQGFEYTLLSGLGYSSNNDDTKSTESENAFPYFDAFTLYSSEIESVSTEVTLEVDSTKTKAYLALKCDIVSANVTCTHYQKWWWGNQPLNTYETTVYVFCNAVETIAYN